MSYGLRTTFCWRVGLWATLPALALVIGLLIVGFSTSLLGQTLQKAPGSEVLSLTPAPGPFTEPAIAINPNNSRQVVAVFQDNAHASYSQDAGQTWHAAERVAPQNYRVSGDVSTTYDNQGHAFICYIAFDKLGTFNYWAHDDSRNGIFVRRSLDGGKTWESKHAAVSEYATNPGIPFEDKPYIVADTTKSRYAGNLYVGWTRWTITDSEMLISRSTDDGQTWSKPIEIDRHPGLPRDDNGAAEGFAGAVGPDGRVYAVWSQGDDIMLTYFARRRQNIFPRPLRHSYRSYYVCRRCAGAGKRLSADCNRSEKPAPLCDLDGLS